MLSNTRKRQIREEQILLQLAKMKFATRDQLQRIPSLELGQDRNALKVLAQMKELIHSRNHLGRNVYYLSKKGADMIGVEGPPNWSTHIDHHLLRNDVYVYFGCPLDWRMEKPITWKAVGNEKTMIPDATFTVNGVYHFLEVDRTQSMVENKKKIDGYAEANFLIQKNYNQTPIFLFYTVTSARKETLAAYCKEKGLTFTIYTKQDLA